MTKLKYDEFLLQVGLDGQIEACLISPDGERRCQDQLLASDIELRLLRSNVNLLRRGRLDGEQEALQVLGEHLYRLLFPAQVDQLFEQALNGVRAQPGKGLRVRIDVDPQHEAATWPLEFLRRPGPDAYFLATRKDLLTLSRRVRLPDLERPGLQPDDPPLRVLVVVSRPRGLGDLVSIDDLPPRVIQGLLMAAFMPGELERFLRDHSPFRPILEHFGRDYSPQQKVDTVVDYCETKRLLGELMAEVRQANPRQYEAHLARLPDGRKVMGALVLRRMVPRALPIEIKLLGDAEQLEQGDEFEYLQRPATYQDLKAVSREWSPHVLHFVGHAKRDDDQAALALEDSSGEAEWCSAEDLIERFGRRLPRLMVLQPCEGALSGTGLAFTSMAPHILQGDVSAVVAMQFAIRNDYALEFAKGLYPALAEGWTVDAAVQEGRYKIAALPVRWKERHFGAPVLFMFLPDEIVQPVPRTDSRSGQADAGLRSGPGSRQEMLRMLLEDSMKYAGLGQEGEGVAQTLLQQASELLSSAHGKKVGDN